MSFSKNSQLLGRTYRGSVVLVINVVTFALFFFRDIFATRFFGLSSRMDAVYLGIMIPSLSANLLFQPLSDLLIPKYQSRLDRKENILHLYYNVLIYVTAVSFVVSLGFYLGKSIFAGMLASGFDQQNKQLVASFVLESIPIVFLGGLIIATNIFLNSIGKYVLTSAAAIFVPIISIVIIQIYGVSIGEISFIRGMLLGQVVNFILVVSFLLSSSHKRYNHKEFKVLKINKSQMFQYGSQNLANLCFYGLNAISASFGTHFHEGTTSLIVLVNKLISFFTNLFNNTFTSVLMPYFSRIYLGDKERFHQENKIFLYCLLVLGAGVIAGAYAFSGLIAHVLFSSSKITLQQSMDFVKYLRIGVYQIPFLIALVLCFKWLTVYTEFKILSILSILAIALDFALNFLLKEYFGTLSILLAPFFTLLVTMMFVLFLMYKKNIGINKKDFFVLNFILIGMSVFLVWSTF